MNNSALNIQEDNKYLVISYEAEIEGSEDSDATIDDECLYGHSSAVAHFEVTYKLNPARTSGNFYPEWENPPEVRLVACSVFWQDQDGGDHEREYDISDEQYKVLEEQALAYARSIKRSVTVKVGKR